MEQRFENIEVEKEQPGLIAAASESLLANLPIIILGLSVFLVLAREILA